KMGQHHPIKDPSSQRPTTTHHDPQPAFVDDLAPSARPCQPLPLAPAEPISKHPIRPCHHHPRADGHNSPRHPHAIIILPASDCSSSPPSLFHTNEPASPSHPSLIHPDSHAQHTTNTVTIPSSIMLSMADHPRAEPIVCPHPPFPPSAATPPDAHLHLLQTGHLVFSVHQQIPRQQQQIHTRASEPISTSATIQTATISSPASKPRQPRHEPASDDHPP
ncbi:hypothetical protein ACLOJK_004816, partial [Asimina triloba]